MLFGPGTTTEADMNPARTCAATVCKTLIGTLMTTFLPSSAPTPEFHQREQLGSTIANALWNAACTIAPGCNQIPEKDIQHAILGATETLLVTEPAGVAGLGNPFVNLAATIEAPVGFRPGVEFRVRASFANNSDQETGATLFVGWSDQGRDVVWECESQPVGLCQEFQGIGTFSMETHLPGRAHVDVMLSGIVGQQAFQPVSIIASAHSTDGSVLDTDSDDNTASWELVRLAFDAFSDGFESFEFSDGFEGFVP